MKIIYSTLPPVWKELSLFVKEIPGFAVIIFDTNYRYVFIEGEALDQAGFTQKEFLYKTVFDKFEGDLLKRLKTVYDKVLNGEKFKMEWDGSNGVLYQTNFLPFYENGAVSAGIILISQRNRIEDKFIQEFVKHSGDGIQVANTKGELVFANDISLKRLGLTLEELKKLHVSDISPRFKKEGEWEKHTQWVKEGKDLVNEGVNTDADGNEIPVEVRSDFFQFNQDEYFFVISRDITERKKLEQEKNSAQVLKKSLEFRKKFLAQISHEIRTPLNGILGISDALINMGDDVRDLTDNLKIIKSSATQLNVLIDNVLQVSKLEHGVVNNSSYPISPKEQMNTVYHLFKYAAEEKNIEIRQTNLVAPGITLYSDPSKLSQLLNNLVSNAIKYSNAGTIEVEFSSFKLKNGDQFFKIKVEDEGVGMNSDQLEKVSSIFSRFSNTSLLSHEKGSGLGLWITNKIISELNGELSIQSEINKGTCIEVVLPSLIPNAQQEDQEQNNKADRFKKVALIDDKKVNLKVAELIFKQLGIKTVSFTNGKDFLESEILGYDAVFLDIQMPFMDGFEVMRRLKESYESLPPIVALTANSYDGFEEELKEKGFDYYCPKPISILKIKNVLVEL